MTTTTARLGAIALVLAPLAMPASAAPTVTTIASFDSTNAWGGSGATLAADGNVYYVGGQYLYRARGDGTLTAVSPIDSAHGVVTSLIQGSDGIFYGLTHGRGYPAAFDPGTAFRVVPGQPSQTIAGFQNQMYQPSSLIEAADGNLYGVAQGGAKGYGAIFKLKEAGGTTEAGTFDCRTAGCDPQAVIPGNDGKLYGISVTGLFQLMPPPVAKGVVEEIAAFPDASFGGSSVAQDAYGNLYGTYFTPDSAVLFRAAPDGTLTDLRQAGSDTFFSTIRGIDGQVYATQCASSSSVCTFIAISPSGQVSVLGDVPYFVRNHAPGGGFIGLSYRGGALGHGEVFRVVLDKPFTRLTAQAVVVRSDPTHAHLQMKAVLIAANTKQPLSGRKIDFAHPSGQVLCSGFTDATGTAKCGTASTYLTNLLNQQYIAQFAGGAAYAPSWANAQLIQ